MIKRCYNLETVMKIYELGMIRYDSGKGHHGKAT